MKILVTGAAGFIGSTRPAKLLERGDEVVGLDNLNDYYDVAPEAGAARAAAAAAGVPLRASSTSRTATRMDAALRTREASTR